MSIKAALYEYLTTRTLITDLVSNRIYPAGESPATVVSPYITYDKISNSHVRHLRAGAGLTAARFDVTAWAKSDVKAHSIYDVVREEMDNFKHSTWGSAPAVKVQAVFLEEDEDVYIVPEDGSKVGVHGQSLIFAIWYGETVTP